MERVFGQGYRQVRHRYKGYVTRKTRRSGCGRRVRQERGSKKDRKA